MIIKNMHIKILFSLMLFIGSVSLNVSALPAPNLEWERIYGGTYYDHAYSVQQTSDGGYVFAGDTASYGDHSSVDAWLYKTDATGNEIWNRTFGGSRFDSAKAVLQITDGYIIAGETNSYGYGHDAWLIKTDLNGYEIWNKTYGEFYPDTHFYSVSGLNDGYILAGLIGGSNGDVLLVRTDLNGNTIWNKTLGLTGVNDVGYAVKQTLDGFIIAGKGGGIGTSGSAWIWKTDSLGNELWHKQLSPWYESSIQSIDVTQDGGFIMAGYIGDSAYLLKTDTAGTEIWNKTYGIYGKNRLNSVQSTADGGYIAAGMYNKYMGGGAYSDYAWLLRTDANGNMAWSQQYKLWANDSAYSVRQTTDGGFIMAGSSTQYTDGWLIKVSTESPADLAITKTDNPDPVLVGSPLTYTITVTNNGPAGATGVVLTDTLPAGVTFISSTPSQGSCSGTTTITCTLGSIANGASATVTIAVTPTVAGTLSNTASVTGNQNDPNTANNAATTTTIIVNSSNITSCTQISSAGIYKLSTDILNSGASSCIIITSSDVVLDGAGFTIDGIGTTNTYGVYVNNPNIILTNITIRNLKITDWGNGIYYKSVNGGDIENNNASSNTVGIQLDTSNYNTLKNNIATLTPFGGMGIGMENSHYNTLTGNMANQNGGTGIILGGGSSNNILTDNNASLNGDMGIWLTGSNNNNTFIRNILIGNGFCCGGGRAGIAIGTSNGNILNNNRMESNLRGIILDSSSNNTIYNNYFNNTNNFYILGSIYNPHWNTTKATGNNIIGGSYLGGNFWAYPNGTGFSQTCADANRDGICDSPYVLDANNTDYLPLTMPFAMPSIVYYIPFLYQRSDNIYDAGVQVQNNGSTQANVEIQLYYLNGTSAGNGTFVVQPGELLTKHAFDITGAMPVYVGPAVVKSNAPVQVQGYIKTVSEGVYSIAPSFTNTATNAYIPFLYQRADNIYDAGVMAFNPGDTAANITIKLYYLNGTLAAQSTTQVAPKAEVSKYAFDLVTGQSIFVGPAEIISDQPIVAQGFIRTKASMIYSIAPSVSTTVLKAYLPFLYQRADNIYDAGVMAFNPGSVAANVTINMYYLNGSLAGSGTYQVGAKAEVSKYAFDIVSGESIFVGPAEVISDQPITVQGFIRTKASMVYSIAPQVRKPISAGDAHVPFLYQTVNASHDAGIMAMNPNSATANINITLYYPNGTIAGNVSAMIGPNAELSKYAFDIVPNSTDFSGSAIVIADQPIVSQGFIRKKSSMIYSIAPPVER